MKCNHLEFEQEILYIVEYDYKPHYKFKCLGCGETYMGGVIEE